MRVDRGSDSGFEGSGSGLGTVRARAMLQALAPRSRTWGKERLISYTRQNIIANVLKLVRERYE